MTNIPALNRASAPSKSLELLGMVEKQLGSVPNIFLTFAHSPAVLQAYLQFNGALASGKLGAKYREQIAVGTAGKNSCDYCASAHTFLGKKAGLEDDELAMNLSCRSGDNKSGALLEFVSAVVEKRGHVGKLALDKLADVGFSQEEVIEIIGHIGMNIFTNYFNHIAGTEVDFPLVSTEKSKSCC